MRQAINRAIDRETIRLELYKGRVTPAYVHGYYEGLPGWDPTWVERFDDLYGYDVEAARALMAEAGYADGFEASAWLFPFPRRAGADTSDAGAGNQPAGDRH